MTRRSRGDGSRPESLGRKQSLSGIPVFAPGVSVEPLSRGGGVLLRSRQPRGSGWWARLGPRVIGRQIELDELGAHVVGLIDGRRSVEGIVEAFRAMYPVSAREAELSTAEFLRSLVRRGVVAIGVR